jgi:glycosyltransferase involved in cell wall biosynthesis
VRPSGRPEERAGEREPILIVIEELQGLDEGSDRFCLEVPRALADQRPVVEHLTPASAGRSGPAVRLMARFAALWPAARRPELRRRRPLAIIYVPAGRTITVPTLLRARLLKALLGSPVATMAFHEGIAAASRWLARWLRPDLLLLTTDAECRAARELGFRAELVWMGVDPERFRPAGPGEKETLRRELAIPLGDYVVLHVGHLFENRNLRALIALASVPGVRVLVVASSLRHHPESDDLQRALESHGVVVLTGYRPRIEELYRLADCYVFPTVLASGAVATPLSVVEARASGLPVVSMRFRALGERVGSALGVELVDSDEELVARTLALRSAPPPSNAVPGQFSWEGVAGRLSDLMVQLAAGSLAAEPAAQSGRSGP